MNALEIVQRATQWVLRGTNTGALPDGTPATGRTVTLPGSTFTQVEADQIHSEQTYFDRLNLFEQLGLKEK
jgi:predicted ester cyclase